MATVLQMEAMAQEAAKARFDAIRTYHAGFPYASEEARAAAWSLVPSGRACIGNIECEAIIPENRTTHRRRHFRFIWRLRGKRVPVAAISVP